LKKKIIKLKKDTHEWSFPTIKNESPVGRSLHSATLIGSKMIVFGGWEGSTDSEDDISNGIIGDTENGKRQCSDNVYCLDLETWQWQEVILKGDIRPAGRAGHSAVGYGNRVLIFGGNSGKRSSPDSAFKCLDDLWMLEVGPPIPPSSLSQSKFRGKQSVRLEWKDDYPFGAG